MPSSAGGARAASGAHTRAEGEQQRGSHCPVDAGSCTGETGGSPASTSRLVRPMYASDSVNDEIRAEPTLNPQKRVIVREACGIWISTGPASEVMVVVPFSGGCSSAFTPARSDGATVAAGTGRRFSGRPNARSDLRCPAPCETRNRLGEDLRGRSRPRGTPAPKTTASPCGMWRGGHHLARREPVLRRCLAVVRRGYSLASK